MVSKKIVLSLCLGLVLAAGCSRQQSDWQKTRETNTTEAYELFLKKYPSGEFTAQAQARVKDLDEERDWEKARDADTPEAYQAFVKEYPDGKSAAEARIRIENFALAQAPGSRPSAVAAAGPAGPADDAAPNDVAPTETPAPSTPPAARTQPKTRAGAGQAAAANRGGRYGIQLGAFKTDRSAADKHWARLQKQYPKVLAGLSSTVLPKQSATGNWYRLQAMGLSEKHARAICSSLKASSEACLVVRPTSG